MSIGLRIKHTYLIVFEITTAVCAWAQQEGCPIRRVEGKYTAEKAELWEWIKEHAGGEVGC